MKSFNDIIEFFLKYDTANLKYGVIYINCGYLLGPFNHNWNSKVMEDIHEFDTCPKAT